MKENKISLTQFLLLLIFIVFTIGFTLSYNELHNFNMIQRSRFVQDVSVYFTNNVKDSAIASDLYDGKKILKKNGGRWEENELDDYLGFFELLNNYSEAGSINERDVNDFFSDYILTAYNNKEIKDYISKLRKNTKYTTYYERFENLGRRFEMIERRSKKK